MEQFTHFDSHGNAVMVDVTEKGETERSATASGRITVSRQVFEAVRDKTVKKGDVLAVAQVAGIMAAKRTSQLIPMCHLLMLTSCRVSFVMHEQVSQIEAVCTVKTTGKTGVEMEALTGVSGALLTIYDMCKAMDRGMVLSDICLLEKKGGKSGVYRKEAVGKEENRVD